MRRLLTILNAIGVLLLAVLCALQWQQNRALNLDAINHAKQLATVETELAGKEKSLKGALADLEEFRGRLQRAESAAMEVRQKLDAAIAQRDNLIADRDQLKAADERQKDALTKWAAAVAERDDRLQQSQEQIQKLAGERNDSVQQFNALAVKYNAAAGQLNQATDVVKKLTNDRDETIAKFNDLANKYNALVKEANAAATRP